MAYNPATKAFAQSFSGAMRPAPKPPSMMDRFSAAGGKLPQGLVDDPARDAYVKGHLRYSPQQGWNLGQYYTPPAQAAPAPQPTMSPAPAPAPAPVAMNPAIPPPQTPGMQGIDPQRFQNDPNYRAAVLGMQERMTTQAYLGSRTNPNLPYMQTMFDRLRAAQLQNRLPVPDPSVRRF